MNHLRRFNESSETDIVEKFFKFFESIGFIVENDGTTTTTNRFARFLCLMAVKQGDLIQVEDNKFKLNK